MEKQMQIPTPVRAASNRLARRSTSGQSMLELALLTPLLLLLLIGSIEIGRYTYFSVGVGNAAHAGAAYASQNGTTALDITNIIAAACYDFNGTSSKCGITVSEPTQLPCECVYHSNINADAKCTSCTAPYTIVPLVQVTATGTFTPIFNYPGIPKSFTVTRTAIMRIN